MRVQTPVVVYGASVLALCTAVLLRWLAGPLLGTSFPFVTLFGAVAVAVWFGGRGPGLLTAVLGYAACNLLFVEPAARIETGSTLALAGLAAYLFTCAIIIGFGAALRDAGRRALLQGESLRTTLAGIDDAVIATDEQGRVVTINPVAETLTGWDARSAQGQALADVFRSVDEASGAPLPDPARQVVEQGRVVGPAGRAVLLRRDGTRAPIDERAVPLRNGLGEVVGAVLVFRDVGARRTDEARLRESEQRLRMALAAARMVAWEYDVEGDLISATGDVSALYGLAPGAAIERAEQRFRLVHPADVDAYHAAVRRALARGESYVSQFRVVRPASGQVVWLEEQAQAFHAADGRHKLAGVVMDITERKRDAQLLAGQKRVLEMVATGAAPMDVLAALAATIEAHDPSLVCAVLLVDQRLRCLRRGAGPGLLDAYVRALEGVPIGPPHPNPCAASAGSGTEVVVRDIETDLRWSPQWRRQALRHGLRACRAVPVRLPDGCVAAVLAMYRREPEGEGVPDPRLVQTATQLLGIVIERQRAADELATDLALMTRLQALSTRLVRAADLTPLLQEILAAAAALSGTDKGDIRLHHAASGRLELVVQQRLGRPLVELLAAGGAPPGDGPAPAGRRLVIEDLALHDHDDDGGGGALRDAALRDGVRALQCTPLLARDGRLLGLLSTYFRAPQRPDERVLRGMDLLARMAADFIERQQAEQALRDADRRKDEFLATLAHELRNPLAPIRNAVEILQRRALAPGQLHDTAGMLERQVRQLFRLVDDLLDMNRVSRGRILLRPARVDLAGVVTQAVEAAAPTLRERGHDLQLMLPSEPLPLQADPARLVQVVGNLLSNANKFSDSGSRITLAVERDGGSAVLRVRDHGIGIEPQQLERIFGMFVQVDTSLERSTSGLGIGLTLAQRLVELHGGTLTAHSEGLGRGSEFVVRLPLPAAAAAPAPAAALPPSGGSSRMGLKLLVVDDNVDGAQSLAELLRVLGHRAEVAHDGPQALAAAERQRPDVVLLDIGLPHMNGHEVCRHIRAQPWGRDMLLVAVTGWGQEADRERSRAAGIDAHLVKPVDVDALLALMVTLRPAESAAG
jgi:PAS domain S-box-containing protein